MKTNHKIVGAAGLILLVIFAVMKLSNHSKIPNDTTAIEKNELEKHRSFASKALGLNYLETHKDVKLKKVNLDSKEIKQMLSENEIKSIQNRKQNPTYAMFEFTNEGSKDKYRYAFLWDDTSKMCIFRSQVVYAGALDSTLIKDMFPLPLNPSFCQKYYQ